MKVLIFCLCLISLYHLTLGLRFTDYNGCIFSLNDSNGVTSTYNLSLFHLTNDVYRVRQSNYESSHREYFFNVCGKIPLNIWNDDDIIIPRCRNNTRIDVGSMGAHGPCNDWYTNGTCKGVFDALAKNRTASAVQITREPHCHWSGLELDGFLGPELVDYNVTLYDPSDSASGIKYTILNGDYCDKASKGVSFQNRELTIEFICPDSPREYFNALSETNISEEVIQYPTCVYTISYETALACPNECIAINRSLGADKEQYSVCNGKGICVSDPNYGSVRCICDEGYTGDLCDRTYVDVEVISSQHGGSVVSTILWLCVAMLVLAVVFAVFLCHRIRLQETYIMGKQDGGYVQAMLGDDQIEVNRRDSDNIGMDIAAVAPISSGSGSGSGAAAGGDNNEEDVLVTDTVTGRKTENVENVDSVNVGVDQSSDVVSNEQNDETEDRVP